jgi:alkylation response protein AidB-like acyl-CoA dehydrogenase
MDFKLEGKYLEIQEQARAFARAVEPIAVEADDMSQLHPGLLAALQESGLAQLMVPAEYGGRQNSASVGCRALPRPRRWLPWPSRSQMPAPISSP